MADPFIYLVMPQYGPIHDGAAAAFYGVPTQRYRALRDRFSNSLLPRCFNQLWCNALNDREKLGITHFAMIHSDVQPANFWLDILMDELQRLDADVVSSVIAIKNDQGMSSTGIDIDDDIWCVPRLSMHEVLQLPPTFSAADAGHPGKALLVNTGLWVCNFTRPWVEQVHFELRDRIVQLVDGTWTPEAVPEDWGFSRRLFELGCKVYATRNVPVIHHGVQGYPNDRTWSNLTRDENHWLWKIRRRPS